MEIAIIALFIVSIALIAFSYSQRDPMKDVEQELETLQLSAMQEIYKLKKKMTVLEEELLETNLVIRKSKQNDINQKSLNKYFLNIITVCQLKRLLKLNMYQWKT